MGNKISVVTATHNMADTIAPAIESFLQQTYYDKELIIVDDGSTDDTRRLIKPYLQSCLIRYIHQNRRGTSAARNLGIWEASGDLISVLDADDFLPQRSLEIRAQYFSQYQEIIGAYSDSLHVTRSKRISGIRSFVGNKLVYRHEIPFIITPQGKTIKIDSAGNFGRGIDQQSIMDSFYGTERFLGDRLREKLAYNILVNLKSFFNLATLTARKDTVIAVGGYNTTMARAEDIDLLFKLAGHGQFGYIGLPLYGVRTDTHNWADRVVNRGVDYVNRSRIAFE